MNLRVSMSYGDVDAEVDVDDVGAYSPDLIDDAVARCGQALVWALTAAARAEVRDDTDT